MLEHGTLGYSKDEYLRMDQYTTIKAMYKFYKAVAGMFGPTYL
jgi:hypothetical protein